MGSLWGTYDESANAASFKDALASWRSGEPAPTPSLPPPPGMVTVRDGVLPPPPGMPTPPAPAPAPEPPARAVAAACYECMRRFTSAGVQCPHTGKRFCGSACFDAYAHSAAGQAALNAALNKHTEPSVAAMGQAQAALPKRALSMPSGKDKLGRSSLDQLRMRLSRGGGRGGARAGRGGARGITRNDEHAARREAFAASFVAAENAARQAGSAAAARVGALQQSERAQESAVTFADSAATGGEAEMNGTGGGGSLWGTYDEAANAASFKDAVAAFRNGGEEPAALERGQQQSASQLSPLFDATRKAAVPKSSCYGCFKLFPTTSAVAVGGRRFCSDACAPAQLGDAAAAVAVAAAPASEPGKPAVGSSDSAGTETAARRPPPAGERWCARDGCDRSFVSWKGVAVVTADQGPLVFCSDQCCPAVA
jgi:hypothetical protein